VTTRVYPVGDLIGSTPDGADDNQRYDDVIETISSTVAPSSWTPAGGNGAISSAPVAKALIISQTAEVHKACVKLLADLRAVHHPEAPTKPNPDEYVMRTYRLAQNFKCDEKCLATIRGAIAPKTWGPDGGFIAELNGQMVVRQTRAVQKDVEGFLEELGILFPKNATGFGGGGIPVVGAVPSGQTRAARF
jgi:hypothetical protein